MKIGRINYLNVLPFYHALDADRWGPFVSGSPKFLGECARDGRIDAAPLPLVDTFDLEGAFEPLGDLGIACKGAVGSVILFSHKPFYNLSGSRLLFTRDSVTSVVLARHLLDHAGNLDYRIEYGDESSGHDGFLAIGDRALQEAAVSNYAVQTDLSQRWHESTGLPFVFARWVVRSTVDPSQRNELSADLTRSLGARWHIQPAARAGMSGAQAKAYLDNMIYRLDRDCLAAIELFKAKTHVLA